MSAHSATQHSNNESILYQINELRSLSENVICITLSNLCLCCMVGQKLIEVYPDLEYDVKRHLDRLHTRWEELVELVRHISNVIGQDNKGK
ncbi:unnamed protein product [Trichobilharzia regenti]|nr:unnamed protein product [Trichobilharzia regenti]